MCQCLCECVEVMTLERKLKALSKQQKNNFGTLITVNIIEQTAEL